MRLSDKEVDKIAEVCCGMTTKEIKDVTNSYYKEKLRQTKERYAGKKIEIGIIIKDVLAKSVADKRGV